MPAYKIGKSELDDFLVGIKKLYAVYAPVRGPEGWRFVQVEGPIDLDGYLLTRLSAKEFVTPIYETLIKFNGRTGEPAHPENEKRLVFGVRPCDARAVRLFDSVFAGESYIDPAYKARRDNTVLVVTACNEPAPTCFCTSTGGGPGDEFGADIMAYEADGAWVMKPVTDKGAEALKDAGLIEATDEEVKKAAAPAEKAAGEMEPLWDLTEAQAAVKDRFDDSMWNELADRCLGCGVCTFVCPSCSCFDVSDEAKRGRGRRYRFWDGCMFPIFTLHASGHNPREAQAPRYRQRVLHKFSYFPERNGGLNLCVGCGRCVVDCPVNIDIREAIALALG
jgi:sulfhydrogenase subunit beta (sulfur reductase)